MLLTLVCASYSHAQDRVERGPIEIVMPGAPEGDAPAEQDQASAASWHERLPVSARLGIIAVVVGVPMGIVVLGRFWRGLPADERVVILLCGAMGRGRGFRNRVKSLSGATGPGGRPITPVAMLLAPRAFDEAIAHATHAERAYGQPLRHAVHGFRKA